MIKVLDELQAGKKLQSTEWVGDESEDYIYLKDGEVMFHNDYRCNEDEIANLVLLQQSDSWVIYEEQTYYYKWKKKDNVNIFISGYMTDEYAEEDERKAQGWTKIESTKTTFEDL